MRLVLVILGFPCFVGRLAVLGSGNPKCTVGGGLLKERRRRRAERWLSEGVFLESPFLLCTLKACS